ncbi:hypothetical protein ACTAB8_14405 [Pseudomonas syringae]
MAAGANEALINVIGNMAGGNEELELMASQLTGIVAAAAVNGDVVKGAEVAKYATTYNRQLHFEEQKWLNENAKAFAEKEGITEQAAMERLSQQALKNTDMLWRSLLTDGDDPKAMSFLAESGKTFVNDLGTDQKLFTTDGNQLFRPEMFADSADPAFYKQFVQSGISRSLSDGLVKELKDSGVALKNGAVDLVEAAQKNPGAVLDAIISGIGELPQGLVDSFKESGQAIGEGAAVALNIDISSKLNAIYSQDVGTAQKTLLAIRVFSALVGAKGIASAGDALAGKVIGKKLDEVLEQTNKADDGPKLLSDAEDGEHGSDSGLDNSASQGDNNFGYLNQPAPTSPPAFFNTLESAIGFISNGRIDESNLEKLMPPGVVDTFKASNTISDGRKYKYTWNGQKIEVKWHAPDASAAAKISRIKCRFRMDCANKDRE